MAGISCTDCYRGGRGKYQKSKGGNIERRMGVHVGAPQLQRVVDNPDFYEFSLMAKCS